jgi:hypothetical protein
VKIAWPAFTPGPDPYIEFTLDMCVVDGFNFDSKNRA